MKKFLSKFLIVVSLTLGATSFAAAQGGCIYFPTPGEYQNQPNSTNVYRVASGLNASGAPVTPTTISTDSTLVTTVTQPANVPQFAPALQICAPAGPYTIQFNTSNVGGGFFNYNFIIPADATKTVASVFKVVDGTDNTKIIVFQSSGASTATTLTLADSSTINRTLTFPDATDTLVGKATTDTLTNKILTLPAINAGLTATGSVANDFSGSSGAFKPSTGTFTFQAAAVAATAGANNFDLSASSGTFKTPTGVGTFGNSANNFTNAITVAPVSAQIVLGTTNLTTLSALSPAGNATVAIGTTTGTLAPEYSCGTTVTCGAAAATANVKIVYGSAPLTSASPSTASIVSLPFTSNTSYFCTASPEGTTAAVAAAGIAINKTSGSAMTLTGPNTVTTVIDYVCHGT